MCGAVNYEALFEGDLIDSASTALTYDMVQRQFEIYSEDSSLLGTRTIELIGYLEEYPSMRTLLPNEQTMIQIIVSCKKPASIFAPA